MKTTHTLFRIQAKHILVAVLVLMLMSGFVTFVTGRASAEDKAPSGLKCLATMKNVLEPAQPTLRRVVLSHMHKNGEISVQVIGQAYKNFPDGKRMVLFFLEPEAMTGLTYLYLERDKQIKIYAYIGAIRRVREYEGTDMTRTDGAFLGTDFTNSDIGLVQLPKECELIESSTFMGVKAYKVKEKVEKISPDPLLYYSSIETWVDADTFLPLQRNYFDGAGKLWKSMFFREYVNINNMNVPLRLEMKDIQRGTYTDLRITNVINDIAIPDEIFDPEKLAEVSKSSLWKMLRPPINMER